MSARATPWVVGLLKRLSGGSRAGDGPSLIVNADDFGMSPEVNRGIVQAFERGIVTSTSLMVRRGAASAAADYARATPELSVGLHLDLGEWEWRSGGWHPLYIVSPLDDGAALATEIARQLDEFRRLTGRDPTHLDSHQHVHREDPLRLLALGAARALGIPLRHFSSTVQYCGRFYAGGRHGEMDPSAVSVDALGGIIAELPAATSELCCHPGQRYDDQYGVIRPLELATLCDRRTRRLLQAHAVTLRSFHGIASGLNEAAAHPA